MLKFLAFEQVFKNALTTLPLGAGKGGADFDPKGKSETEVMRFCQSFMTELQRHIGPDTDVPAGDIGVGGREIGYLFGQYKRIRNEYTGVLTGKGLGWGGSLIRPEATGYGAVYFAEEMLADPRRLARGQAVPGLGGRERRAVHGREAARPRRDPDHALGHRRVHLRPGRDRPREARLGDGPQERAPWPDPWSTSRRSRGATFTPADPTSDHNLLWNVPADGAFPSAIENEINEKDAREPREQRGSVRERGREHADRARRRAGVLRRRRDRTGPGKAANAGGVAVSGLEMSQNSMRVTWDREVVDDRLRTIMRRIHEQCRETAEEYGKPGSYFHGANIAGFTRVADAMLAQGVI